MDQRSKGKSMDAEIRKEELEVFRKVLDRNGITPEALAAEVGLSKWAIYKYCSDDSENHPGRLVWQALYKLTGDELIPKLMTGNVPVLTINLPPRKRGAASIDHIKKLIEITKTHTDCMESLVDILKDGKIDEKDRKKVIELTEQVPEAIKSLVQVSEHIKDEYEHNTGRTI